MNRTVKPHYSVLIIGAGINGCGLFRDLCLQGVDCLLIDRGDICGGASSAPSRLIHGGIKYLETGEFRLVRESAMERNRLLRNAPHYVKPIETVLPVKSWFGGIITAALPFLRINTKLRDRGAIVTELGLQIYDFYSRKIQALPDHRFFGPAKTRSEYPAFSPDIKAAGVYSEGRITHAERLGLELIADGLAGCDQSALRTYSTATREGTSDQVVLTDGITGETSPVSCDVVVNAAGAWIDMVNAGLGIISQYIGGSKGSHLIVDNRELVAALRNRMIYFGTADGRVNLVYPFFGNALVGATDIPVADPDGAHCSAEETEYLLNAVHELFPAIRISPDQIRLSYCGVRPLPRNIGKDIGTVSRDHSIERDELPGTDTPVLSLIGGKWTTFRAFAAQSADLILQKLGRKRLLSTENIPIGGGRNYPQREDAAATFVANIANNFGIAPTRVRVLFERYGTSAVAVAETLADFEDWPLATLPSYSSGEIAHICRKENVRHLSDILLRRSAIAMEGLLSHGVVVEVADLAAAELGWSTARISAEILLTRAEMRRRSISDERAVKAAA